MAAWVRSTRGQLTYAGHISRAPFVQWAATSEGRAIVAETAGRIRFALLGKRRAAARRLWRQIAAAARDERAARCVGFEIERYSQRLGELAFADGLPRVGVDLRRLVVVPRLLLNGAASDAMRKALIVQPAFASLEGGSALLAFYVNTLIAHADAAVAAARPGPSRPLTADSDWVSVGIDFEFEWHVPLFVDEPVWQGHHYMLELRREPIRRSTRNAIVARIEGLERSLQTLSRIERSEVLRRAVHSLRPALRGVS